MCLACNVHPLPDNVSTDAPAIRDSYACAVHAMHRVQILPYMNVVILGAGAVGMTLGQVVRARGARSWSAHGTSRSYLPAAREPLM